MDVRHLRTFEVVASLLNFTRAAEVLGYAQSSVTGHVRALEEEAGQPLFERLGKRVALTEAGRRLLPYAAKILALADEAGRATRAGGSFSGTLRIASPESLLAYRLPAVFRQFRARFPAVQMVVQSGMCQRIREDLRAGSIDIGFLMDESREESDLVVHPLIPEPIIAVTYPWHPLADKERVLPQDLNGEYLIHTEADSHYRIQFDRVLAAEGARPASVMEFNSIEAIKQCVMAGLGITVLPRVTCEAEFEQGSLVELTWAGPPIRIVTQIGYHKDKWMSPVLTAFLELVQQTLVGQEAV